jgi:predicted DNA-binding transcriptional regulator AlpA
MDKLSKELIRADDFAAILDISKRTLSRLRAKKLIPLPVRIGGSLRWRSRDVRAYLDRLAAR